MKWLSSILLAWTLTVTSVVTGVSQTTIGYQIVDPVGVVVATSVLVVPNARFTNAPQSIYGQLRGIFNATIAQAQHQSTVPTTITQGMTITNEDFPQ